MVQEHSTPFTQRYSVSDVWAWLGQGKGRYAPDKRSRTDKLITIGRTNSGALTRWGSFSWCNQIWKKGIIEYWTQTMSHLNVVLGSEHQHEEDDVSFSGAAEEFRLLKQLEKKIAFHHKVKSGKILLWWLLSETPGPLDCRLIKKTVFKRSKYSQAKPITKENGK